MTPDAFRRRLSEMSVYVATSSSGEVVGTIAYEILQGGKGYLRGMAALPRWHGTGLSVSLLESVEDELRKAGCKTITLDTTEPLTRTSEVRRLARRSPEAGDEEDARWCESQ